MEGNINRISKFLMNHVGYEPKALKKFVYTGNGGDTFTVARMVDGISTEVYRGRLTSMENDTLYGSEGLVGDFSALTEEGVYRIHCGEDCSRIFPIQENVYEPARRILAQFFVWQRCGDGMGWSGKRCHTDDKLTDKYGVTHHFVGGHHQSGDLRKWTFGAAYGTYWLSNFLKFGSPSWSCGNVEYDVAHSAKYYLSLISREGYVFDCTFVPEDYDEAKCKGKGYGDYHVPWHAFKYFDRPTSPFGHTNVIRLLASASAGLKEHDPALAAQCLTGARQVWDYMVCEGRHVGDYDWEIYPPIGHDHFKKRVFDFFYEDSAPMLACFAQAGIELYLACGDENVKKLTIEAIRKLSTLMVYDSDGALDYIRNSEDSDVPQEAQLFVPVSMPQTYAMALESFPKHEDSELWKKCAEGFLKRYEKMSGGNIFGKITNFRRQNAESGSYDWVYQVPSGNKDLADTVIFLAKLAPVFEKERCLKVAQRLLDWIMGANPYDASSIENVGCNQPMRAIFGEFLPCQPQMPGGVMTEVGPNHFKHDGFGTEYDMPITGSLLYALALYERELRR